MGHKYAVSRYIIWDINQPVRYLFQLRRIILGQNTGDYIAVIKRIVHKDSSRMQFLQWKCIVVHHRYISRKSVPLIMPGSRLSILKVKIRNGHHKGDAVRSFTGSLPYTFHTVPHGGLVGHKHHSHLLRNLFQGMLCFPQKFPGLRSKSQLHPRILRLCNLPYILAVFLQQAYYIPGSGLFLCGQTVRLQTLRFNLISNGDCRILRVRQSIDQSRLIPAFHEGSYLRSRRNQGVQ